MNHAQDLSMWSLIANASIVVQLVMLVLLLASFISWWHIFTKVFSIKKAVQKATPGIVCKHWDYCAKKAE